jgi:molecular chaperone GrpE
VADVDPDIARLDTDDDTADARLEESGLEPGVEELAAKAGEYLALAQRTRADFENFRKRASRDAALAQERGLAKLAKELLPAIDNLGRALQAAAAEAAGAGQAGGGELAAVSGHLVEGVKLVQADLLAAFARVGIEPYSPEGEVFDPQLHEAVAQAPVEGAVSGTVVEVYQQGYRLGETVLRPARVLVAA